MEATPYTPAEMRRFSELTDKASRPGFDNTGRVLARLRLDAFVEKHGRPKCEAMVAQLKRLGRW